MAFRTSPERVKEIMEPGGDYKPGMNLDPFMKAANLIVSRVQAEAADYDLDPMDAETAAEVEAWLAAWAYKMSDRQLANLSRGRATGTYTNQNGKRFEANSYGVMAMELDPTGLLAGLNSGTIVGTAWLGKATEDMLTWGERNTETL